MIAYNTDRGHTQDAVNIRGNPTRGAYITGNQFRVGPGSIKQTKTGAGLGLTVWDNLFNFTESSGGTPGPGSGPGSHNPTQPQ